MSIQCCPYCAAVFDAESASFACGSLLQGKRGKFRVVRSMGCIDRRMELGGPDKQALAEKGDEA